MSPDMQALSNCQVPSRLPPHAEKLPHELPVVVLSLLPQPKTEDNPNISANEPQS